MNVPQVRRTFRLELIEPAGRFVRLELTNFYECQ
jgi:hypothetical protein